MRGLYSRTSQAAAAAVLALALPGIVLAEVLTPASIQAPLSPVVAIGNLAEIGNLSGDGTLPLNFALPGFHLPGESRDTDNHRHPGLDPGPRRLLDPGFRRDDEQDSGLHQSDEAGSAFTAAHVRRPGESRGPDLQLNYNPWVQAFAGMTTKQSLDPGVRRDDGLDSGLHQNDGTDGEDRSDENASAGIRAYFDGSLKPQGSGLVDVPALPASSAEFPNATALLERADDAGIARLEIAQALQSAKSQPEAVQKLSSLGLLRPGEFQHLRDASSLDFLLLRLWYEAAGPESFPKIDANWPIPAVVALRNGVRYCVHGIVHGSYRAAGRGRVRALVAALEKRGLPLYSEQNFPKAYGYDWGKETLDHSSENGSATRIQAARISAGPAHVRLLRRLKDLAVSPGALLLDLGWLVLHPASPWAWLLLPFLLFYTVAASTSMLFWLRLNMRLAAKILPEDPAHHYRVYADRAMRAKSTVEDALRVELPTSLKSSELSPETLLRSKAMADAIRQDAQSGGATEVHILGGINHAQDIAWHLENNTSFWAHGTCSPGPKERRSSPLSAHTPPDRMLIQ